MRVIRILVYYVIVQNIRFIKEQGQAKKSNKNDVKLLQKDLIYLKQLGNHGK